MTHKTAKDEQGIYARLHSNQVVIILYRGTDGMYTARNFMDTALYLVHGQEIRGLLTNSQVFGV